MGCHVVASGMACSQTAMPDYEELSTFENGLFLFEIMHKEDV
jgi:hypothetical protein